MSLLAALRAQVEAEVKSRLRSPATAVALLGLFVASFLWIPDPRGNAVSISWTTAQGEVASGVYTSSYVGASSAMLASLFLSFIGFYLVAGSVRRDRERGVGAILAATPLAGAAYLGGKLAAHAVYLLAVGGSAIAAGLLVFARHGTGPFVAGEFFVPFLLLTAPGLVFVAGLALLFDVAPGLSGRTGLVLYFFVWSFGLLMVPAALHGGIGERIAVEGPAVFDPLGLATFLQLLGASVPGGDLQGLSIGIQIVDEPIARVNWPGLKWTAASVVARLAGVAWAALPFGLSLLFFDRFDPARRGRRGGRHGAAGRAAPLRASAVVPEEAGAAAATAGMPTVLTALHLPPATVAPRLGRAVAAEARMLWTAAGPLRWLLVAAALLAAAPGPAGQGGTAALLLLLAPAISEAAARERLAGTGALVFSQPSVPASIVLWKASAVAAFVGLAGLPRLAAATVVSPERGLTFLLGLAFVATLATGAGALSGGGKLFTALYVVLWYGAINGVPALDFSGAFAPRPSPAAVAALLGLSAGVLALAVLVERRRRSS